MRLFHMICLGLSQGVLIGFLIGCIKMLIKKEYSEKRKKSMQKLVIKLAAVLKYLTILLLLLGLIWCVYFLALGWMEPEQTEYANNMSELIVSVLTVISIIFAFVEFIKHSDQKKG